ncbi:hypothetical protein NLG97_g9619 [Lecanicillium saksenae]|uniref:Uncharacterized protein n=1 Tax=Lecanicillium saksenae TaxID=468837 RepID=A0ACC1QHB8_9HYPO|nr:hypothetical protein NLG97_g9619 [Lecanicillium saksenae]
MYAKLVLATLASVATARFAGDLTIRMNPDGSCYSFVLKPHDTAFPNLICPSHFSCHANGNQIADFSTECRTNGHDNDSSIAVRPHDELQFCRSGFCTCMGVNYQGQNKEGTGLLAVNFNYNDDQAKPCAKW